MTVVVGRLMAEGLLALLYWMVKLTPDCAEVMTRKVVSPAPKLTLVDRVPLQPSNAATVGCIGQSEDGGCGRRVRALLEQGADRRAGRHGAAEDRNIIRDGHRAAGRQREGFAKRRGLGKRGAGTVGERNTVAGGGLARRHGINPVQVLVEVARIHRAQVELLRLHGGDKRGRGRACLTACAREIDATPPGPPCRSMCRPAGRSRRWWTWAGRPYCGRPPCWFPSRSA